MNERKFDAVDRYVSGLRRGFTAITPLRWIPGHHRDFIDAQAQKGLAHYLGIAEGVNCALSGYALLYLLVR